MVSFDYPANAVTYNWEFINEDGNLGNFTDVVSGFVEFDATSFDDLKNQIFVPAIDFQITNVTGLTNMSAPLFGDGGIELNTNLVTDDLNLIYNGFSFDENGDILKNNFMTGFLVTSRDFPTISGSTEFFGFGVSLDNSNINTFLGFSNSDDEQFDYVDIDSNTLKFEKVEVSVNEFSPTWTLIIVGGIFTYQRFLKRISEKSK